MDGLIALFVVIAIVNALTSSKRKKRQEAQQRALQGAAAQAQTPRPRPARQRPRPQAQVSAPEELQAHLAAMDAQSRPAPQVPAHEHGEGRISTQGESEAEHAAHRLRAAAEEKARREEHEALRELRAANRDKLRTAVVMSEVLGKPVALRPRTGLHR